MGLNLRRGLPSWLSGKKFACQHRGHRRRGFDPWIGKIPWRRKWQPIPVFLTGESHEQRSLAGNSPSGHRELDTTEQLSMHTHELEKVQTWEGSKPSWLSFSAYEVKWSESRSLVSNSLWPHGLPSPWNSGLPIHGQNTGVGSLSLLQGTCPTQRLNTGLPHCRRTLYQLSHKGSLFYL